ncbi:Hypothetical predicted protein [Pelobates cultripes]|uniref:Uncharacterized protein n=1 Tax=Pelobates cultripes TaxID=61616 RepID=A0AAD1R114_PELCU|nr:Hypothetical predicted protein [Pelobates cultripes]
MQINRSTRRQSDYFSAPTLNDTMGKRNKKLKTHPEDGSRKIGDLFLARPKPKMAATPDPQSSSSEEETLDAPDPIPEATDPVSSLAMGDLRAPATKDMAILQEEVTAVTGRVRVAEEDITAVAERQQAMEEKLIHLQSSHQALQARLDGLDDSTLDKMAVMLSGQSPYQFEGMQFTFLQDLCRATLTWRRSVQRVTTTLRAAGVRYRWGPSMLVVTKGATTYRLTSTENAETFLGKLGLKAIDSSNPTPNCSWDVPNIIPFVPRSAADTG